MKVADEPCFDISTFITIILLLLSVKIVECPALGHSTGYLMQFVAGHFSHPSILHTSWNLMTSPPDLVGTARKIKSFISDFPLEEHFQLLIAKGKPTRHCQLEHHNNLLKRHCPSVR